MAAALDAALAKVAANARVFADCFPENSTCGGVYHPRVPRKDTVVGGNSGWTTAFWTGQLWLTYQVSGDARWRELAQRHSASFTDRLRRGVDLQHHDLGFLYTLSSIADYRLTGSLAARATALAAASALMQRYLAAPGVLQAWGTLDDAEQRGRTIIDAMMNLPLLSFAAEQTGEPRFAEAALRHARQSARWLVRADGTTHHTYYFDPDLGAPRYGRTRQGASDDSCWARGQAWGIYGFALAFFHFDDPSFLDSARRLAEVFLARLPADRIAYWDLIYSDGSLEPRDASACAIAACGLFELARTERLAAHERIGYRQAGCELVDALAGRCAAGSTSNALLLRGTHNKPKGLGIEEANLWGDYFYLEALVRVRLHARGGDWPSFWRGTTARLGDE